MTLTPKQSRFVEEYLVDLNATQAAVRAGYSERTANEQGARLLANVSVAQAIAAAQDERSSRTQMDADQVLRELGQIGFFDPAALRGVRGPEDVAALPPEVRRVIVGWSWDKHGNFVVKLASKMTALELLGRHFSMWNDKLKHDVTDPVKELLDGISDTSRGLPTAGGADD